MNAKIWLSWKLAIMSLFIVEASRKYANDLGLCLRMIFGTAWVYVIWASFSGLLPFVCLFKTWQWRGDSNWLYFCPKLARLRIWCLKPKVKFELLNRCEKGFCAFYFSKWLIWSNKIFPASAWLNSFTRHVDPFQASEHLFTPLWSIFTLIYICSQLKRT